MRHLYRVPSQCAAIVLAACWLVAPRLETQTKTEIVVPNHNCGEKSAAREWQYGVAARIRPLVFWTGWKDVGEGRIRRSEPDRAPYLELLVGTDPKRAPLGINRWGYIAETVCGPATQILGIMTASDEETIEEATANVGEGGNARQIFKAIRGSLTGDQAFNEVLRLAVAESLTYRDIDALLSRLPPPGTMRQTSVPPGAHGGFLTAVSRLVQQSQAEYRQSGKLSRLPPQSFVFAGKVYDLTLRSVQLESDRASGGRTYPQALRGEFEVRNRATGKLTRFKVEYAADEVVGEAPLRVVYQPRWWLQIELRLRGTAPSRAGGG